MSCASPFRSEWLKASDWRSIGMAWRKSVRKSRFSSAEAVTVIRIGSRAYVVSIVLNFLSEEKKRGRKPESLLPTGKARSSTPVCRVRRKQKWRKCFHHFAFDPVFRGIIG
jgi:hypothetical protein